MTHRTITAQHSANVAICIVGPTGAGKTAMALALAELLPVEVINADSRQVYADFPVITAQPTVEEQQQCPHRLYGFLQCDEKISAGIWSHKAHEAMLDCVSRARLPLLVGGTGLYVRALFEGMAPIPSINTKIAQQVAAQAEQDIHKLQAQLQAVDPALANRLHANDKQRIARGVEVFLSTGKPLSEWHKEVSEPLWNKKVVFVGVGLPLPELTPYLIQRIDVMLEQGAVQEAEKALQHYADGTLPGWSGIGCKELFDYLQGNASGNASLNSLEAAKQLWIKNTRAYAKRQLTWFRGMKDLTWFSPFEKDKLCEYVLQQVQAQQF